MVGEIPMIIFNNLTKVYDSRGNGAKNVVALDGISFAVQPGEFLSVVGRSGAGKTTLFKLMLVEEKPTHGSILYRDQNIHKLGSGNLNRLRRSIGAVFQDYKLLQNMTVRDNIAYVMKVIGASNAEIEHDVPRILEIVELQDRAKNYPSELSGARADSSARGGAGRRADRESRSLSHARYFKTFDQDKRNGYHGRPGDA
jgi:cell division transport system ATP-binding protein